MSKERAKRRAQREREAAIRAAARAAADERDERRAARRQAIARRLPRRSTGRQTGILARRRQVRISLVLASLLVVNLVVWVVRPDWAARLGVLLVTLLLAPMLLTLSVRR